MVKKALAIAHGIHETGRREILSIDVGETETEAFSTDFLRGLVARGLVGVQLAISDAQPGLRAAIAKVLGCAWQREGVRLSVCARVTGVGVVWVSVGESVFEVDLERGERLCPVVGAAHLRSARRIAR